MKFALAFVLVAGVSAFAPQASLSRASVKVFSEEEKKL